MNYTKKGNKCGHYSMALLHLPMLCYAAVLRTWGRVLSIDHTTRFDES